MRYETVTFFGSGGRRLVGVLRLPDFPKNTGIITVHGWGANRIGPNNMLASLCAKLAGEGYPAFDFDLSGRGDSEGEPSEVNVDDMMDDATAAIGIFRERAGVEHLVLFGLCSGGNVALGAVACGAKADAVIAVSTFPFVPIEDVSAKAKKTASYARGYFLKLFQLETYRKLFRGAISFKGVYRTLFGHISKNEVSSDRILKDTKRDVLKGIAEFKGMILHIYASADPECEPSRRYFEKFYANNSVAARFITVEEANHNFYSIRSREEVYKATVKILDAVI